MPAIKMTVLSLALALLAACSGDDVGASCVFNNDCASFYCAPDNRCAAAPPDLATDAATAPGDLSAAPIDLGGASCATAQAKALRCALGATWTACTTIPVAGATHASAYAAWLACGERACGGAFNGASDCYLVTVLPGGACAVIASECGGE